MSGGPAALDIQYARGLSANSDHDTKAEKKTLKQKQFFAM